MLNIIEHYGRNTLGQDYAVGDIHGYFTRLQTALDGMGFNPATDRLFSVGDTVDRGPESEKALDWHAKPWFHAVRGNHEDIAIRFAQGNPVDRDSYLMNGGGWFMDLAPKEQLQFAHVFSRLPFAIEVETTSGLVGLIHADCPKKDWFKLDDALRSSRSARDLCLWSRKRLELENRSIVAGVRAVVVGHTPVHDPVLLGNVHHIDTAGWTAEGHFTLLNLETLIPSR